MLFCLIVYYCLFVLYCCCLLLLLLVSLLNKRINHLWNSNYPKIYKTPLKWLKINFIFIIRLVIYRYFYLKICNLVKIYFCQLVYNIDFINSSFCFLWFRWSGCYCLSLSLSITKFTIFNPTFKVIPYNYLC